MERPLDGFYKHSRMADGHLNKCKECTKKDVHNNYTKKLDDLEWVEKELARQREKSRKARQLGLNQRNTNNSKKEWIKRNKHKRFAHEKVRQAIISGKLSKAPCEICGSGNSEAHHEDYSRPLDVSWLCPKHHNERHIELRRIERLTNKMIKTSLIQIAQNPNP
jgi:hypothetical protein